MTEQEKKWKEQFDAMSAEDIFERQLLMRAKRLVQLLEIQGPRIVLAGEMKLIMRAGFALYPEEMGQVLGEAMKFRARLGMRICMDCDNKLEDNHGPLCVACLKKRDEEDKKLEVDGAMTEKEMEEPEEH